MQVAPAAPTALSAPSLNGTQVTINGRPIATPQEIYQGYRAARKELGRQMDDLNEQRQNIVSDLASPQTQAADKKGLESRITQIDQRITDLDKAIADADAQVAKAAAVPGAAVEPPQPPRQGPPDEVWVLSGLFIVVVFFPLSIAFARRIWRRSAKVVTSIPKELSDRLIRVEQTVEATAVEIERIGEGQRFITRLFSQSAPPHALPSSAPALETSRPGDVRP